MEAAEGGDRYVEWFDQASVAAFVNHSRSDDSDSSFVPSTIYIHNKVSKRVR